VAHRHGAPAVVHREGLVVHLEVQQVLAGQQEVPGVPLGVEGHDVVGQQALDDRLADVGRQHAPVVRLRPWDVHEEVQERLGCPRPDARGCRVQVVVVDHHDGIGTRLEGLDHGVGEQVVGHHVALRPRREFLLADVRHVRQIPQVVLDEPQHGVGDHVVVALVDLRLHHHEASRRGRARLRDGKRAVRLGGDPPVAVLDGRRYPQHRHDVDESRERGHEPAPGAHHARAALPVVDEAHRAPVRNQDERPPLHASTVLAIPRRSGRRCDTARRC